MKKILLSSVAFVLALSAFAMENATVRIIKPKWNVQTKQIKMKEIEKGVYRAVVPVRDIPRDALYVDIIPEAAKAKKGEEGFYVMPDGSYIDFSIDKGKYSSKRIIKLMGFKTPRGSAAVIAKGMNLECNATVHVENGNYELFTRYDIQGILSDPYEDIVIDYYKLEGDKANYSEMAKVYRKWQLDRGEVKPLKERVKGNKTLENSVNSIFVKVKFSTRVRRGVPRSKWADIPMTVQYTFEEGRQAMTRMHEAGMKDIEFCFTGWQKGGHDGPYPDLFPIPEELGGEKGMIETVELGKKYGFQMTVHGNNHDLVKSSVRYNSKDVSWDNKGNEFKYTILPGGQVYFTCYQIVHDRWLDEDIEGIKRLGITGTQHIDVTTARPPNPCCNPLHPANRKEQAEWQRKVSQKFKDHFGGYSSEAGFDHIAGVTDYVLYVNWTGGDLYHKNIVKKVVPIWELVYHGIILSGSPFYGTMDATYERENEMFSDSNKSYTYIKTPANRRLKVFEFGSRPTFYYIDYKAKDYTPMKKMYDDYMKLRHLQYEFMESHEELAQDVFLVKYSDGSEMIFNYRTTPFEYRGRTVKAKEYELYNPSLLDKIANWF